MDALLALVEAQQARAQAQTTTAAAGSLVLGRRDANTKLFFISSGEVVGVLRDGGVSSVGALWHDGEVVWRRGPGQYFGEDALVLAQEHSLTDAVATESTSLVEVAHSDLQGAALAGLRDELRRRFLRLVLDYALPQAVPNAFVDGATTHALSARTVLSADEAVELFGASRTLVVAQGTLTVRQGARVIGAVGVGQALPLSKMGEGEREGDAAVTVEAAEQGTRVVSVPAAAAAAPSPRPSPSPQRSRHQMARYESSENVLAMAPASSRTISPKADEKRISKRPRQPLSLDMSVLDASKVAKRKSFAGRLAPLSTGAEEDIHGHPEFQSQSQSQSQSQRQGQSQSQSVPARAARSRAVRVASKTSPKKRCTGVVLSLDALVTVDTLGHGAFGKVSLVRCEESNVMYALKALDKQDVVAKKQVERVVAERTLMAKHGSHPFVTSLVRSFNDVSNVYLLLECGLGGDLFDFIEHRPTQSLTLPELSFVASQVVQALEYLHKHNVVYRDLKPENCVLCLDGYLRITDFGMAKELGATDQRTYTMCGTLGFIAPEILTLAGYGTGVDWWCLGVFLYELAMGAFPFVSDSMPKLRSEHKAYAHAYPESPVFDRLAKSTASDDLVHLVRQLLHPNASLRLGNTFKPSEHAFFGDVDMPAILRKEVAPPPSVLGAVAKSKIYGALSKGHYDAKPSAPSAAGSTSPTSSPPPTSLASPTFDDAHAFAFLPVVSKDDEPMPVPPPPALHPVPAWEVCF